MSGSSVREPQEREDVASRAEDAAWQGVAVRWHGRPH